MSRPSKLPEWGTQTGSNVVTGLNINNINWQSSNTIRYTFSASPDLSGVVIGHYFTASGCTNTLNNGTYKITAVNNTSKYIDIINSAISDNSLDETGSPGTGLVKTLGSVITEPTTAKKQLGWIQSEKPPQGFLNYWQNLVYLWINYFDGGGGGSIVSYDLIADLTALNGADLVNNSKHYVMDFGVYQYINTGDLSTIPADGETVLEPADSTGRLILILPDPNGIFIYTESSFSDIQESIGDLQETISDYVTLDFPSIGAGNTEELTATIEGAEPGDIVSLGLPILDAGLVVSYWGVTANDTVTIRLYNYTGSPINPDSLNFSISIQKFSS